MSENNPMLHYGIAEQGKLLALDGDHIRAVQYYRYAMKMAVEQKAPEVFFRHYLECSLESLELMDAYDDIFDYCDKAIALYETHPPTNEVARKDLASIHQRRGVVELKKGMREKAVHSFKKALALCECGPKDLPLSARLLNWLNSGYQIDEDRIVREQRRHKYFSVRTDTVKKEKAIRVPGNILLSAKLSSPQEAYHAG